MKTAQDSYTITIKQIVRFQERMHLEKFQVDKAPAVTVGEMEGAMDSTSVFFGLFFCL